MLARGSENEILNTPYLFTPSILLPVLAVNIKLESLLFILIITQKNLIRSMLFGVQTNMGGNTAVFSFIKFDKIIKHNKKGSEQSFKKV